MKTTIENVIETLANVSETDIKVTMPSYHFIQSFVLLINRCYPDAGLNLEVVSKELKISKRSIQRKLLLHFNMSFREYINEIRFYHARSHLSKGYTIQETAQAVGFNSSTYFSASFKRRHNQSPKVWQNAHRSVFQDYFRVKSA